ncbi:hypothetical protein [Halobacterium sp. R2-5]|uniref:hypothetical protein n=1 Tax=Halobacterium sp. R2-5 TaxID=2715751 RepID=UPI00141DBE99|nr:hypothetical protein [Halobacterium sp. R2-5]NIC00952.1 hypothetical protein [Halobacterium sp. R2-5]
MTDEFEDEEALEEHLEAVKPDPVDQAELDELVEPSVDVGTGQDDEQAAVDDAAAGGSDEAGGTTGLASDELDELAEPVMELRTVQELQAVDEAGDGNE